MKKQVFKTDAFFVENTDDKKQNLANVKDSMQDEFMKIAFKINRSENQRMERIKKRGRKTE